MDRGYTNKIRERIEQAPDGTLFILSDFGDVADSATVRQILKRMTDAGVLRRVINGIFEKPKFSTLLHEYVATDPDDVARALARNYHWTIFPGGNSALNLLGLSTQVPAVWSYVSDGPSKTYRWNNTAVEFKHRTNREITGLSCMTGLVVQALKTLGKTYVTPEVIQILSRRLSEEDKEAMLKEAAQCTDWVYDTIRRIAKCSQG